MIYQKIRATPISGLPFVLVSKPFIVQAFHVKISFIHVRLLVHLHANKTNFHMKDFSLGLSLKQR